MSNTVANQQTDIGCAMLDHNETHSPPKFVTKGRGKRMKTWDERVVEH